MATAVMAEAGGAARSEMWTGALGCATRGGGGEGMCTSRAGSAYSLVACVSCARGVT